MRVHKFNGTFLAGIKMFRGKFLLSLGWVCADWFKKSRLSFQHVLWISQEFLYLLCISLWHFSPLCENMLPLWEPSVRVVGSCSNYHSTNPQESKSCKTSMLVKNIVLTSRKNLFSMTRFGSRVSHQRNEVVMARLLILAVCAAQDAGIVIGRYKSESIKIKQFFHRRCQLKFIINHAPVEGDRESWRKRMHRKNLSGVRVRLRLQWLFMLIEMYFYCFITDLVPEHKSKALTRNKRKAEIHEFHFVHGRGKVEARSLGKSILE